MADNTSQIAGLFMTPEMYQQAQQAQREAQAIEMAKLSPFQQGIVNTYMGVGNLVQNVGGALGGQDPQLKLQSLRQSLARGKDLTSSEGWANYAKELQAGGDLQGAALAAQKSTEIQSGAELKQAKLEQQLIIEREKNASRESLARMAEENRNERAALAASFRGATTDLQRQLLKQKIDQNEEKRLSIEEAQQTKLSNSISTADNIISVAKEALPLVSGWTTGTTGQVTGMKAGSNAYVLQSKIDTIKAQLGFAQLQQMRDASPTGGALGQVAVQELNYLQAALTNLDRAVGEKELKANLEKVVKHYTNWREAVTAKQAAKTPAGGGAGNNNDPLGIRR